MIPFAFNARSYGGTALPTEDPDAAYIALAIDATGQPDGTSYTTEESRYGRTFSYLDNAAIASGEFDADGVTDAVDMDNFWEQQPNREFTWEVWGASWDAINDAGYNTLFGLGGGPSDFIMYDLHEYNGDLVFRAHDGTTLQSITLGSAAASTKYNFAVSWDGTTLWAYLNGAYVGQASLSAIRSNLTFSTLFFDLYNNIGHNYMNGQFEQARFTRKARYTGTGSISQVPYGTPAATTTDPNWADTYFLLSGGTTDNTEDYYDESPSDIPYSNVNGTARTSTSTLIQGGNSIYFDGTGYIAYNGIDADDLWDIGADDFTLDVSFQADALTGVSYRTLISKYASGGTERSLLLDIGTSPMRLRFLVHDNANTLYFIQENYSFVTSTEYHVRICRDGSTWRAFVNGVYLGEMTADITVKKGTDNLRIGGYGQGTTANQWNGYMGEIRLIKGVALNTDTSSFTPPSSRWDRG